MGAYTQNGSIKLHGANAQQEIEVDTIMGIVAYDAIKDVLAKGKVSVTGVVERKLVPLDKQVRGVGSAKEYRLGKIFLKRANQGDACVTGLIPKDDTARGTLKTALMGLTFQGEKPIGANFSTN